MALRSLGVTEVSSRERETAEGRALQILNANMLDFLPLAEDYRVMQRMPPQAWSGSTLPALALRSCHGAFVLAIKRGARQDRFLFLLGRGEWSKADDALVVMGCERDVLQMQREPCIPQPVARG